MPSYISITAHCRLLTPMVTSRADTTRFELGAPAVRGALRFWWRAYHCQPDLRDVHSHEAALFGDTRKAGAFRIAVSGDLDAMTERDVRQLMGVDENLRPVDPPPPRAYFYFPVRPEVERDRETRTIISVEYPRQPAHAGQQALFTLKFTMIPSRGHARDLLCALWLLETFGGIGGRTRRGAGSFKVCTLHLSEPVWEEGEGADAPYGSPLQVGQEPDEWIHQPPNLRDLDAFCDRIRTVRAFIASCWGGPGAAAVEPYTRASAGSAIHVLRGVGQGVENVTNAAASLMRGFRTCYHGGGDPSMQAEAAALHARNATPRIAAPAAVTKTGFGLPIKYRFNPAGSYDAKPGNRDRDRRGSPLFVSFAQSGSYAYAVFSYLPAQFLPAGEMVRFEGGNAFDVAQPGPPFTAVEDFLAWIPGNLPPNCLHQTL